MSLEDDLSLIDRLLKRNLKEINPKDLAEKVIETIDNEKSECVVDYWAYGKDLSYNL